MNRLNIPAMTMDTIRDMEDMSFFTHALIFDDLLIVSQKETCCFVLKSSEELIVIDAIWPCEEVFQAINEAVTDVGWNVKDIHKLILTHGHTDHTGCGRWLKDAYGVKTYLSRTDDKYWMEHPVKPDRPETWKDYDIDVYIEDGDIIESGNKRIYVLGTPGHTPGCLSYIFEVCEEGRTYQAAIWGGSTPPFDEAGTITYRMSLAYFLIETKKMGVTVALSNHTAFDQGLDRIAYSRNRLGYMPNIYELGKEGYRNFCQVYYDLADARLESFKK